VRFAFEQWRVVRLGVTSFEFDNHIKVGRRLSRPHFYFRVFISAFYITTGEA